MTTDEKLIRTTYVLGTVPLTGGLTIFFIWWAGKAWFVTTLHEVEEYGIYWVLVSIPVALIGLLTGGVYLFRNFKTKTFISFLGLLSVLINIPAFLLVLLMQQHIESRAYFKIYNRTNFNIEFLKIENSDSTAEFKRIDKEESKIGYFYPKYVGEADSAPIVDEVTMTIRTDKGEERLIVPRIYQGECIKMYLDGDFALTIE